MAKADSVSSPATASVIALVAACVAIYFGLFSDTPESSALRLVIAVVAGVVACAGIGYTVSTTRSN
ncbi:hypothetical protein [Rhodococcus sp. 14-2483-1-1]|uniref:hypothetical protein n=1 Tax=Rhodococcus sp. 14-2483-1-1 TaxID=2023148 RepID=UPI0011400B63|nr:hypothetical protein [Rhodococcus sp. 14-2483-1-1]